MIRIGIQFQEERKNQSLTLEEVARATKIREEFLSAIEKGDHKKLPSPAYAYGFVRNYAKFLGLPVEKSLALFRREFNAEKSIEILPKGLTNPGEFSIPKFKIGRSSFLIGFALIIIVAFLFFQYRSALFNPNLKIENPAENQTINSLTVEVRGETDPNATLSVDNEQIPIDADGNFKKQISVFPGRRTLNFQVENKFGRTTSVKRTINVVPSE